MPLNSAAKLEIQTLLNLIPVSDQFNYLGIRILPFLSRVVKWNYQSLLGKIKNDLQCWAPLCLALHGRIATIKMSIHPRLSFYLAAYPYQISGLTI